MRAIKIAPKEMSKAEMNRELLKRLVVEVGPWMHNEWQPGVRRMALRVYNPAFKHDKVYGAEIRFTQHDPDWYEKLIMSVLHIALDDCAIKTKYQEQRTSILASAVLQPVKWEEGARCTYLPVATGDTATT